MLREGHALDCTPRTPFSNSYYIVTSIGSYRKMKCIKCSQVHGRSRGKGKGKGRIGPVRSSARGSIFSSLRPPLIKGARTGEKHPSQMRSPLVSQPFASYRIGPFPRPTCPGMPAIRPRYVRGEAAKWFQTTRCFRGSTPGPAQIHPPICVGARPTPQRQCRSQE